LGSRYGPAIVRRLIGPRLNPLRPENPADTTLGGVYVDFWAGTLEQNVLQKLPDSERGAPNTFVSGLEPEDEVKTPAKSRGKGKPAAATESTVEQALAADTPITEAAANAPRFVPIKRGKLFPVEDVEEAVAATDPAAVPGRSKGAVVLW
jgi:hypothetical protein